MRSSIVPIVFSVAAVILTVGCSFMHSSRKADTAHKTAAAPSSAESKWKRLVEILDHYDEMKMVTSEFESRAFMPDGTIKVEEGRHVYSKGRSQWVYFDTKGRRIREINCYEDKVVVKMFKYRRRRKEPKIKTVEIPARYTCALQALIHYTGALDKNRLEKGDKVIIVHDFDPEKGIIRKITLVKNNISTEILFKNVSLVPDEQASIQPSGDASETSDSTDTGNPKEEGKPQDGPDVGGR